MAKVKIGWKTLQHFGKTQITDLLLKLQNHATKKKHFTALLIPPRIIAPVSFKAVYPKTHQWRTLWEKQNKTKKPRAPKQKRNLRSYSYGCSLT